MPAHSQAPVAGDATRDASDPFALASPPPDFLDLDMAMSEALADLGKGSFDVAQMNMSPIMWLSASTAEDALVEHAAQQL